MMKGGIFSIFQGSLRFFMANKSMMRAKWRFGISISWRTRLILNATQELVVPLCWSHHVGGHTWPIKRGIEMDSDVSRFDCDGNKNWIWKIVEESEGWCVVMEVSISQNHLLIYVLRKELFFEFIVSKTLPQIKCRKK